MFDTAIAGSLPKPSWLAATGKLWPQWKSSDGFLARIEGIDFEHKVKMGNALRFVPKERLIACTHCGLAPMRREVAEAKLAALGRGAALARQRFA